MVSSDSHLPIISILPNLVTVVGLIIGLTSIRYSIANEWQLATALIVISAFIDGLDGRLARALNATSKFGASLDSLADFINFGVAPSILIYMWSLNLIPYKGIGWAIATLVTICCALRLATFNSSETDNSFFYGVSAPCAGGLILVPIMLSFKLEILIFHQFPILYGIYAIFIALLMVSKIPTISIKEIQISKKLFIPLLILLTIFTILLVTQPWITLPFMGLLYTISIPITVIY